MMTVKEYLESPRKTRIRYRLYRNPLVMFFLGPMFLTIITNRFVPSQSDYPGAVERLRHQSRNSGYHRRYEPAHRIQGVSC